MPVKQPPEQKNEGGGSTACHVDFSNPFVQRLVTMEQGMQLLDEIFGTAF